jgi:DNA-binding FadR family transcriptional regulator
MVPLGFLRSQVHFFSKKIVSFPLDDVQNKPHNITPSQVPEQAYFSNKPGLLPTQNLMSTTRATALAEQIRERIQAEQLRDGDLFMTEAQVAEEFGTSRNVTREAVSQLCALGILEGRKRKGLLVRWPNPIKLLSHSLPSLAQSEKHLSELAKLRYVLEVGAIELAVANATAEQIERLGELAGEYEEAIRQRRGEAEEDRVEIAFHGLILEMTGAKLIVGMQQVLARYFEVAERKPPAGSSEGKPPNQQHKWRAAWQHHEIVSAIRDRDVGRARSLMRIHFQALLAAGNDNEEL